MTKLVNVLFSIMLIIPASQTLAQEIPQVMDEINSTATRIRVRSRIGANLLSEIRELNSRSFFTEQGVVEPEDLVVDHEAFCEELNGRKPANCDGDSADQPRVPNVNTDYFGYLDNHANGCGNGSFSESMSIAWDYQLGNIPGFTGNRNVPFEGVDLTSACNEHDACYASQGSMSQCDTFLEIRMDNAIRAQYVYGSEMYRRASTSIYRFFENYSVMSALTYAIAGEAFQCALWHSDMQSNGCSY